MMIFDDSSSEAGFAFLLADVLDTCGVGGVQIVKWIGLYETFHRLSVQLLISETCM